VSKLVKTPFRRSLCQRGAKGMLLVNLLDSLSCAAPSARQNVMSNSLHIKSKSV
jgi:hypothetical protein